MRYLVLGVTEVRVDAPGTEPSLADGTRIEPSPPGGTRTGTGSLPGGTRTEPSSPGGTRTESTLPGGTRTGPGSEAVPPGGARTGAIPPRASEAVPLGGTRLRALVAVLAVNAGRAVPAGRLIGEVWADEPPADAPGALQALIARLRKILGRDAITSEPGGYRLAASRDSVDLYVFERLVQDGEKALTEGDPATAAAVLTSALALWRGPALADLPDRTSAAARPEALRVTALRLRIEADLALGRAADVLPLLHEAVADHPLDETFRAQLIRSLRAAGRPADALVAYDEARTVLAETLGADPGPELRALHAELLKPPPAPTGNLRARLTSFVGREADLADIRRDLAANRLVTLTGPGGSGKTRLAQETADAVRSGYPDGVWLAELAPLEDASAIPQAVLSALGRREAHVLTSGPLRADGYTDDPLERLLEHCGRRCLLLVLDNCEHLIGQAAALTAELLAACPDVTVLATSREPLGVPGEVVRPVEPLPQPTAYRLFAERAAAVRPGAAPYAAADGGQDAVAVREICRRLDGLPLAIELAAARLRALSPRQIADRLDDRFRLLTSGSRTVLPRQQTLRAVVDWSWDLLTGPERATLCALSVFAGGCTLAAAEAVCGPDTLEILAQLVDKSLVVADLTAGTDRPAGPEVRYRLLETIHEYAAERGAGHPRERAAAARRHTAYYLGLARTAEPGLRGPDQLRWLDVLEIELDNVRAALHRAVEARDEPDAVALVLAMGWFWWLRNYREEADGWLERVVELAGAPTEDPADPMFWQRVDVRMLHFFVKSDHASEEQLSTDEARATAELLIRVYAAGGPQSARFPGLLWPFTAYILGGSVEISRHTDTVVENCRRHGDDWALAAALMFRTHVAVDSPGGLAQADDDWAELQALSARVGDRWISSQVHTASAEVAAARGDYDAARAGFEAAYRLCGELGAYAEGAFLLARLGDIAHRGGDDETAGRLLEQAEAEADRFSVWDARTYIRYLQAVLLLRRGEVRRAGERCALAIGRIADGTPPPAFHTLLIGLSARVTAADGDPRGALDEIDRGLRMAVETSCTESVLGAHLDTAAEILTLLDDPAVAMVLLSAADAIRGRLPRSLPEREAADAVVARARAALPAAELAAARERGAGLGPEQAAALVAVLAVRGRE